MRLVVATCTVDYDGRLTAHLPQAKRLIMVKADGCVAVHADGGAYKPLNWMNAPNRLIEDGAEWRVVSPKGETLVITMHDIHSDTNWELGIDPGLQKDGVEAHLQELLAHDPSSIAEGYKLVRREFPTDIGPVDLLCRDEDDAAVAIEVKRRGDIDGVEQLSRYLEFLNQGPSLASGSRRLRGPRDQATGKSARQRTIDRVHRGRLRRVARDRISPDEASVTRTWSRRLVVLLVASTALAGCGLFGDDDEAASPQASDEAALTSVRVRVG